MTPSITPEAAIGIVLIGGCLLFVAWQIVAAIIERKIERL